MAGTYPEGACSGHRHPARLDLDRCSRPTGVPRWMTRSTQCKPTAT
ncbi:hypothetical protein Pd630_LPD06588 [Rhodococcus opacus PD630]|nr:hypothetical protein Pd630_LPD06588 [Rhodococcus opacus PD630]